MDRYRKGVARGHRPLAGGAARSQHAISSRRTLRCPSLCVTCLTTGVRIRDVARCEFMTIARRLILLVAVPLVVLLALGFFGRMQFAKIQAQTEYATIKQAQSLSTLAHISRTTADL